MKFLRKSNDKEIMLVAETKDDWDILDFLYHSGIIFGAYMLYKFKDSKPSSHVLYKWLLKNFPNCYGIIQISVVKNFASKVSETLL